MFIVYLNTDSCLQVLLVETLTEVCKIVHLQIVEFPHDSTMAYLHSETESKRMNWFYCGLNIQSIQELMWK